MNRRGFLGAITGILAGAVLEPERLLWVPGRKLISIPEPTNLCVRFVGLRDYWRGDLLARIDVAPFPLQLPRSVDYCGRFIEVAHSDAVSLLQVLAEQARLPLPPRVLLEAQKMVNHAAGSSGIWKNLLLTSTGSYTASGPVSHPLPSPAVFLTPVGD